MAKNTLEEGYLWLPSEFPYEYASADSSPSSVLSSPVESAVSSTESESDGDDSLTGLTRRFSHSSLHPPQKIPLSPQNLETLAELFGSPESTLRAAGSWSVSNKGSPNAPFQFPKSPLGQNDDAWDVIYSAAGQVPRLNMNGDVPLRVLPLHPSQLVKPPDAGVCTHRCFSSTLPQIKQVRERVSQMGKEQSVSYGGYCQSPWPPLLIQHLYCNNQTQNYSGFVPNAVFHGGSNDGVKKSGCAGTGVFLPRRYVNPTTPTESRKKKGFPTPPPRARVSQLQKKNFNAMAAHQAQPCFNGDFIPQYDNLMGRRNAVFLQQKVSLPHDWTY